MVPKKESVEWNTRVSIGFTNKGNGQARGHIVLLARQEGKVICFESHHHSDLRRSLGKMAP